MVPFSTLALAHAMQNQGSYSLPPISLRVPNHIVICFKDELKGRRPHRFVKEVIWSYPDGCSVNGYWHIRLRVCFHATVPRDKAESFIECYGDECNFLLNRLIDEL